MSRAERKSPDPLRELARERGRILGEYGVSPRDAAWARAEAEAIASLTAPDFGRRILWRLRRLFDRLRRATG